MTAWRDVEVAAAEAIETGRRAEDLEAIRARDLHRRGGQGARGGHRPRRRRVRRRAVRVAPGPAGRWIHYGLTSSDVLDTALGAAAAARGRADRARARASWRARSPSGRASSPTRCASGAPTACTPSRRRSGSSSPASRSRRTATPSGCERAFDAGRGRRDLRRGRHLLGARARTSRRACSSGSTCEREDVSTQVVPRDRHAELLQAIALAGAGLERFATEIRHLQRTEVREVEEPFRAGQKGSSAMPHKRNPITTERITGLARVLRGNAQAARRERRAVARARHLALRRRARDPARRDDPARLHAAPRAARRARAWSCTPTGCARNLDITCGALFSQTRAARARRGRDDARRRVPDRAGERPSRRGTRRRRCASCSREPRTSALDLDAIFDYGALHPPRPRAARAARRDPACRHERGAAHARRPGASADLFHALPLDILDPFLYVELRRPQGRRHRRARARPHRGARRSGSRCSTRSRSGSTRCSTHGVDFLAAEIECDLRALPRDRPRARDRAARLPARLGRQAARRGHRAARRRRGLRPAPARARPTPSSPASAAPRSPPTPRWAPPRRCCASCRPGSRASRCASAMQRGLRGARRRAARDRDRRPRRAVGLRPRGGLTARSSAAASS